MAKAAPIDVGYTLHEIGRWEENLKLGTGGNAGRMDEDKMNERESAETLFFSQILGRGNQKAFCSTSFVIYRLHEHITLGNSFEELRTSRR